MSQLKKTLTNIPFAEGYRFMQFYSPNGGNITAIKCWFSFIEAKTFTLQFLVNNVVVESEIITSLGNEIVQVVISLSQSVSEFDLIEFALAAISNEGDYLNKATIYFEVI